MKRTDRYTQLKRIIRQRHRATGKPVSRREIAKRAGLSDHYCLLLLGDLVCKDDEVQSRKGGGGGYWIAGPQ